MSMDLSYDNWTLQAIVAATNAAESNTQLYQGLTTVALTATATGTIAFYLPEEPVIAGKTYAPIAAAYGSAASLGTLLIQCVWYDSTGATVGSALTTCNVTPSNGAWTEYQVQGAAPAGAVYARRYVQMAFGIGAAGTVYIAPFAPLVPVTTALDLAPTITLQSGQQIVGGGGATLDDHGVTLGTTAMSTEGGIWTDSTQKTINVYRGGVAQQFVTWLYIADATTGKTVANTVTETSLIPTGVGTLTLPANFLLVGKTARLKAWGTYSVTGTPTMQIKFKAGTTILADTLAVSMAAIAGAAWEYEAIVTCVTAGSSGKYWAQGGGIFSKGNGSSPVYLNAPQTGIQSINTTTPAAFDLTATWGTASASNTITCSNLTVEILG